MLRKRIDGHFDTVSQHLWHWRCGRTDDRYTQYADQARLDRELSCFTRNDFSGLTSTAWIALPWKGLGEQRLNQVYMS
jgi:hypothetical protein